MNTITLTGPAYPTHDTPLTDGYYLTDTSATGFLPEPEVDELPYLVHPGDSKARKIIESKEATDEKSIEFIQVKGDLYVTESWDLSDLRMFDNFLFLYDNELVLQPVYGTVHTGDLNDIVQNPNQHTDSTVFKSVGGVHESVYVVSTESLESEVDAGKIERLRSAYRTER